MRTFALRIAPLLLVLTACEGVIVGPIPGPVTRDLPGQPDAGPPACEPGRQQVPKLLRLSNHEYRNLVNDVLGVQVDPALYTRWTPVAEVYGFDTMSETRIDQQGLEEQLATAESLAALVLATPALLAHCPAVTPVQTPVCNLKPTYSAQDDFSDSQGRECWTYVDSSGAAMVFDNANARWRKEPDQGAYLWRTGGHPGSTVDAVRKWQVPVDGALRVFGSFADTDPGGGDGIAVAIRRNGTDVFARDVPNGTSVGFDVPLTVSRGDSIAFVINGKTNPSYDSTGLTVTLNLTPTPRKSGWTWSNCVEPLVARLASRSFRRPVRAEELADYQALYESSKQGAATAGFTEPVDEALQAVLQAVFLSPNVVFKPELVPGGLDATERAFGVASRLSLFTRASVADEQLWMLAGTGGLATPAAVRAQAERLLTQDLERFSTHFAGQWLAFREPGIEGAIAASMQKESRDMFSAVFAEDLPPERLLRPGFTIVDAQLAGYYWFANGEGSPPWRIPSDKRGGVLSQAAFLSRTGSGSEFRRPIHRGLWVLTRLMCQHLPRIDPATLEEIAMSQEAIDRNKPLPEQMALHRNSASRCGSCHNTIDPIGLALENYDGLGHWRDTYPSGVPIVSDLKLAGVTVRDPLELAAALENTPEYRACVSEKLLTFALNRGPREEEACVIERLGRPLDGSKPTLKTMTLDALMKALELTEVTP